MSKPEKLVIYPKPPDSTRIQFLTKISTSAEVTGVRSGFAKMIMGEESAVSIMRPYGITATKNKLFVCDVIGKCIYVMDFVNKTFEVFNPEGFGSFRKPINTFVDDNKLLYVADIDRKEVLIFDENLRYLYAFGKDVLEKPSDVSVYGDKIYVADIKLNNVFIFDKKTYDLITPLVNVDISDTAFIHQPTNIFIQNDKVYVSDLGEPNVKVYNLFGDLLMSYGSIGLNLGDFIRPKGIAVDRDENLFAVDGSYENVQIFNDAGKLLMFFGGPYNGPGDMYLPVKIAIDYENNAFFEQFVDPSLELKYVLYVTNQYGPDKITIYGAVKQK